MARGTLGRVCHSIGLKDIPDIRAILAADKTTDSFQGDAVLSNGRILVVLRKQDAAVDVYGVKSDGAAARIRTARRDHER